MNAAASFAGNYRLLARYNAWFNARLYAACEQLDAAARTAWEALTHFFNHQTHHRGQVTALLMQAGVDPGTTDLLSML